MNTEQLEKWIEQNLFSAISGGEIYGVVSVDDLRALFAGKVLVPVEPTDAMIDALFPGSGEHTCRDLYKAMIAASQEQIECYGCGWKGTEAEYQTMTKRDGFVACCPERKINLAVSQEPKQ